VLSESGSGPASASAYEAFDRAGHIFVVQTDLRRLMADAVLFPTRSLRNPEWFPDGPPFLDASLDDVSAFTFTTVDRVRCARPTADGTPAVWLGWSLWEFEGEPPIEWFVTAAEQFLHRAYAAAVASPASPVCGRQLPLLALPVIGTGQSGGSAAKGELLVALMSLLSAFVATRPVDVVLVTKSRQMLSAAQAARTARTAPAWDLLFEADPRLRAEALKLASLASRDRLVLFLGSGICRATNLPGWRELLSELATLAGLGEYELAQV